MTTVGEKVAAFVAKINDSQPIVNESRTTGNEYADMYGQILTPNGGDSTSFNLDINQRGNVKAIRLYSDDINDEVRIMLASGESLDQSERTVLESLISDGEVTSIDGVVGRLIVRAALGTTLILSIENPDEEVEEENETEKEVVEN